jgi:Arc/MetJ-type ribon-helix-helix transcriptional regulator
MNAQPKKTWVLSDEVATAVESLIERGVVADLDEVVQVALGVLPTEADPELDALIEREVLPVIEEMDRHPERAIPLDEAWAQLEAHIARRRARG